ncbi:MAG: hypothetical protein P4L51_28600 [Puia sp.]|nr:hypothetical protein [Puia sp.]
MEFLNWDDSKSHPFDYRIHNYQDVVSNDFEWAIEPQPEEAGKCLQSIPYYLHLKTLATLQVEQIRLLSSDMNWAEVETLLEAHVQIQKPVSVWIDYPFEKSVKATLYPLVRLFDLDQHASHKVGRVIVSDFNYYAWQTALVYADIYKNHYKEVGVYMHGFDDLYLESLELFEDNVIRLGIGS